MTRALKMFRLLISTFPLFFVANLVAQQSLALPDDSIELIEVIASKDFQSLDYKVLRRDDFIHSAQSLTDVLNATNGIQIRQISGVGNPVSISIRGSTSKQVQLYIDGQLINDSQFGGFDLNQLALEQIQSIEISKSQAIGTGVTPLGGVIRINTYNPADDTLRLSLGVGSFGYRELNLIKNKSFEDTSISFGLNHLASANDYSYLVPQTFENSSLSQQQKLRNNGYDKKGLFINAETGWGSQQLRFNFQYTRQHKELANYQNNSPQNNSSLNSDTLRYGFEHNWSLDLEWLEQLEFELYRQVKDERYFDQPYPGQNNQGDYRSVKYNGAFKSYLNIGPFKLTPFVAYDRQDFKSKTTNNYQSNQCNGISGCDVSARQNRFNFGSRVEWSPARLPINAYVLLSQLRERNSNRPINQPNAVSFSADNTFNTQELGLSYQHDDFELFANWSDGVRTPTLFELFGDRGSFKGNDDLEPERARTLSVGGSYNQDNYAFTSSIYKKDLENSIVAIFNSSNVGSYRNVSSAQLIGIELQANYQFNLAWSSVAQVNIINSETYSHFVAFNLKKLPGIYHQQYSVALQYEHSEHWNFKLKVNVDNELYFNRANTFENKQRHFGSGSPSDRITTDFNARWKQGSWLASLSLNNLFNAQYQDLANRSAHGRSILLKLSIEKL